MCREPASTSALYPALLQTRSDSTLCSLIPGRRPCMSGQHSLARWLRRRLHTTMVTDPPGQQTLCVPLAAFSSTRVLRVVSSPLKTTESRRRLSV